MTHDTWHVAVARGVSSHGHVAPTHNTTTRGTPQIVIQRHGVSTVLAFLVKGNIILKTALNSEEITVPDKPQLFTTHNIFLPNK